MKSWLEVLRSTDLMISFLGLMDELPWFDGRSQSYETPRCQKNVVA